MKRLPTFLFSAGVLGAQYAVVPSTQYPALESILNAKPAMTRAAGAPSGNCTQSLDLYLNTTNGDLYVCSATNTWLKVTGAGGAPSVHATTHKNGGGDEVATATPGANAIPKAGAGGTLAAGWIPTLNQSTSGNAATATALATLPTKCSAGNYPLGVDASGNAVNCTVAGGGGSTPGGAAGTYQYNNAGSLGGQAFIFSGGGILTESQKAVDMGYVIITQGGNLTLSGTADQVFTLANAVSCNTRWSRVLISVTTAFSGGSGGLFVKLQHGSVDLTPLFDVTQTGGDINFYSDIPGPGCLGSGTAALQLVFTGDGTNKNLFTAGSVTVEVAGYAAR